MNFSVLYLFGVLTIFLVFSLINFRFFSIILLLELLNILFLLTIYLYFGGFSQNLFIIFMVVTTIEVTFSLVILTRVWDWDSLLF